jgi:hypothetical protein
VKLSGHMSVKGAPPARSRVCAQAECSEARLVAPGADPGCAEDRGPASYRRARLVQTCHELISTVTETKQGVTPGKKTPGPAKYFITLQRSGLPAGASRCLCDAADVDLSDAWVGAHDARMTPTNENRTNEEAAPTTAFVARFAFHARAHLGQVARSAPFHDRARDAATS